MGDSTACNEACANNPGSEACTCKSSLPSACSITAAGGSGCLASNALTSSCSGGCSAAGGYSGGPGCKLLTLCSAALCEYECLDDCNCMSYKYDPDTHVCQHFSTAVTCATTEESTCTKKPDPACTCTTDTTTTTSTGDPHLTFAHGGRADFKGDSHAWYNMLSARNTTFNMLFIHDDFHNPYKLVHGSAMKGAAWVVRTNVTGRIVTIEYNASASAPTRAMVRVSGSDVGVWVSHSGKPFTVENVRVEMREKKLAGIGKNGAWHGVALIVSTGQWRMSVWNKPFPNAAANPGKALLNMHIEALYDADHDVVAPHGLIGQSYDGDGEGVSGALDDYQADEVTTKAMAEGAIEGKAENYKMAGKFAVEFRFARFDKLAAKPRDVSALSGSKTKQDSVSMSAGAGGDGEER